MAAEPAGPLRRAGVGAASAVGFLTVLPVRIPDAAARRGPAAAAGWFPLVGALVGAAAGGVRVLCAPGLGPQAASVLAVAAGVLLTGALHQDGLADCADGIGARGGGRDRRLAVMRDPATGVFGVLAIVFWVLLLAAAIARLGDGDALRALVIAAALGRWAAVVHARIAAPARSDGLGAGFDPAAAALVAATITAAAVALALVDPGPALVAMGAAGAVGVATTVWARQLLGGRTGDTLGATVALAEVSVCLALVAGL